VKDLVSRQESAEDRRVRIVALTPRGRKHAGHMRRVFSELNPEERRVLEVALKKSAGALTRSWSKANNTVHPDQGLWILKSIWCFRGSSCGAFFVRR
jgi:hypothetical protein